MRLTALILFIASTAHAGLGLFPRTGVSMKAMKFDPSFPKDLRPGCTFNAPLINNDNAECRGNCTPTRSGGVSTSCTLYLPGASGNLEPCGQSGGCYVGGQGVWALGAVSNLCLWSCDLSRAAVWAAVNCTTAFTSTGPDGVANGATRITATADSASIYQNITSSAGVRITSVYIKRITGTGTISLTNWGATTWEAVTITTDWTRVNTKASGSVSNPIVGIQIATSGDAVDVWGFQHDKLSFVSPGHLKTEGAAGSRSADVLTYPVAGNVNSPGSCAIISMPAPVPAGTTVSSLVVATNAGGANGIQVQWTGAFDSIRYIMYAGSASQADFRNDSYTRTTGARRTVGMAWAANDIQGYLSGISMGADTTSTMPASHDTIGIGYQAATVNGWGTLANARFVAGRLSTYDMARLR